MISNGAFTITKIDKKAGGQKGKTFLTTCLVYREGGVIGWMQETEKLTFHIPHNNSSAQFP